MALTAPTSTSFSRGLVGVSIQTIRVCGVQAASTASGRVASTKLKVRPIGSSTCLKSR